MLITAALLVLHGPAAPLHSEERLHYSLGGMMSGPIDLKLSFTSGNYSLRDSVPAPGGEREERTSEGQLSPQQTARLRALALYAIRKGFETRECKQAIAKGNLSLLMPFMDAMPTMDVSVAGRRAEAPANAGCWSKAADDLAGAALQAVTKASR